MENNYTLEGLVKKNYHCSLLGHRYVEIKKINSHFSEYECMTCKLQVTNDTKGQKILLTSKLKDINNTLWYLHLKREFTNQFYIDQKRK